MKNIYLLGGFQSDFAQEWSNENRTVFDLFAHTLENALECTGINPEEIQRGHVGNASGDSLAGYAQMGGFFAMANELLAGMPASRHEAACCSGTMAVLGAISDIAAGLYDLTCVVGIEVMSGEYGYEVDKAISAHAWPPTEIVEGEWTWPKLFSQFLEDYKNRYDIKYEHLGEISRANLENAKDNPNARGRNVQTTPCCFTENEETNPVAINLIRTHDVCRIADGATAVFLASEEYARKYASKRRISLADIPRIKGFGHSTMPTSLAAKRMLSQRSDSPYYMPHLNNTIQQALRRAGFNAIQQIDGMEVHDCFNINEYIIIDHCGLTSPGEAWRVIEDGTIMRNGSFPVNPSGGLIGGGHPIGCTGVRMALDCFKQVTGQAGGYQVFGAKNMMTVNVGGTLTTVGSLVIGVDD